MKIDFNYYKFPKKKQINYDVKIDMSGLASKTEPSVVEKDEKDEISEVNLAEVVDNNINYVYTYCPDAESQKFSYFPLDDNGNKIVNGGQTAINYRLIGENVIEVDLIDYTTTPDPSTIQLYDTTWASIVPRHTRFMNNTDPIVEKGVFAALGLMPNNKMNIQKLEFIPNPHIMQYGFGILTPAALNNTQNNVQIKYDLGLADSRYKSYITRKKFRSNINNLADKLRDNGIELNVKEYNQDVNELGYDKNYTGIHTFYNFYGSRSLAPAFIARKKAEGEMDTFTPDQITPFNLSIKEVFKGYFTPAEELYDEFIEELSELLKAINSNSIINSFVDDSDIAIKKKPVISSDESQKDIQAYIMMSGGHAVYYSIVDSEVFTYDGQDYTNTLYQYKDNGSGSNEFITDSDGNIKRQFEYVIDAYTDINEIVDALPHIKKQVNKAASVLSASAFISLGLGGAALALCYESIATSRESLNRLKTLIKYIRWYQHYTNESVFPTKQFISDNDDDNSPRGPVNDSEFPYDKQMCRLLVPVYMGTRRKKVRRKGLFGRKYTTYIRVDMGVRWVEINFIDTNTYSKYRKNDTPSGISTDVNISIKSLTANGSTVNATLKTVIPDEIMNTKPFPSKVAFTLSGMAVPVMNGSFTGSIIDSTNITFKVDDSSFSNYTTTVGVLNTIILPMPVTKPSDDPKNIKIAYTLPHLPYDSELRRKVFSEYGAFDQGLYANKNRNGDYSVDMGGNMVVDDPILGWEIFHDTSKNIKDLRSGIDIYNKVQLLMKILTTEFGSTRVHLIETTRSYEDQDKLQLGGSISGFLSWHNYGLAVKIRITQSDNITPIKDASPDMMKLLNIAESFVDGAKNGMFGTPMNVVWCGQLVTGPDLFVWEFLPIGVNHKDALKFRDLAYTQFDPIVAKSYVNVSERGYIVKSTNDITSNTPYINDASNGMKTAINIQGDYWVDPAYINNYAIPNNLVLKDIKEFLTLVDAKMKGNGTELMGRKIVSEWKAGNPTSFDQLVVFYSLIGNYAASRGLLSGDYIEKFSNVVNKYYTSNPIKFVKMYLGDMYYNIKIQFTEFADASYISLYNGKLTTPLLDARSTQKEGNGNTFGQKQLDFNSVEFGQYQDGVFVNENNESIITITTDTPVINGYDDNGNPVNGDALILHSLIADQIYTEYTKIVDNFNKLNIDFMYDSFYNSPNVEDIDFLENEFGVINTQDLMTFSQLRDMYARIAINNKKADGDGTVKGAGANIEDMESDSIENGLTESVFEKLVSTSQQVGARKSRLTKEKPVIEQLQNGVTLEKAIAQLTKKRMPRVNDIL